MSFTGVKLPEFDTLVTRYTAAAMQMEELASLVQLLSPPQLRSTATLPMPVRRPLRERCTTAKTDRVVTIRPHHDLQAPARHQAATDPAWQDDYRRWRPMVERAVAWLVARGNRRLRYCGTAANYRWLHHRAAALNLRRLVNFGLTSCSDHALIRG